MNISGVSSLNSYYSSSTISGRVSATTTASTTEDEQGKVGKPDKPPQGPPPGPPPGEGTQIDSNSDSSWDSDELTSYSKYASEELGTDLDVESLMSEYDSDSDGVLGESEIQSLMDNNGLQLKPPPSKMSSPEEQAGMMAQMQSTTSLNASTLNILDYLSEDEEDEDSLSITSLEATKINIEDYLSTDEEDEETEEEELTVSELKPELLKAQQQEKMFEAYKLQADYTNSSDLESSLFFA